ncbi:hypothetical protein K525DRAFT_288374 [Schizophyllum commune Loenen D]|nr:hypothetical protein K525DRAFT_288374 [Schizophyllum commune Loenen D]
MPTLVLPVEARGRPKKDFTMTLPNELLSYIFLVGQQLSLQEEADSETQTHPFELLVCAVNCHWRQAALGTALLWHRIDSRKAPDMIAAYLRRSHSAGLHLRLVEPIDPAALALILVERTRWATASIGALLSAEEGLLCAALRTIGACPVQRLSITFETVDGGRTPTLGDVATPQIFLKASPSPVFVRLRGFALLALRPRLNGVVTLHLDLTRRLRFSYALLSSLLTSSPFLAHLSMYGYCKPTRWPEERETIHTPALRSLRLKCMMGRTYSELLTRIEAPGLLSLALRDVQNDDLDGVWALNERQPLFPKLETLTCIGCEFSDALYPLIMSAFPTMKEYIYLGDSVDCPYIWRHLKPKHGHWLHLERLSFLFDEDERSYVMVEELKAWQGAGERRTLQLRPCTAADISDFQAYATECGVEVEKVPRLGAWPDAYTDDEEDILFW